MISRRGFTITILMAALLALVGLAAACGDDDGADTPTASATTTATTATTVDVQAAIDEITVMVSAAQDDDLAAAQVAFDAAHDPLHAVIDGLEATNPDLATELDEAVDDAEADLEDEEEAEHIVEVGNEILGLLQDAAVEIGS